MPTEEHLKIMTDRENKDSNFGRKHGGRYGRPQSGGNYRPDNAGGSEGVVFGRNAVIELLKSGRSIDKLYVKEGELEGSAKMIVSEAAARGIPVIEIGRVGLDRFSGGAVHQGVVAFAAAKEYVGISDILDIARQRNEDPFVVILDGIEDPYNLGAIIRTAECAGVHGVIIPKRRTALMTMTVEKASAGALEHMAVAKVPNLTAAVEELKNAGLWIYAAEAGGQPLRKTDMRGPAAIVLGSEGGGISPLLHSKCDFTVSIPLKGKINSLNVSAAAAVVLFEAVSQRDGDTDLSKKNG